MKAMILAAGRGERMRPLTDQMPKPLLQAGPNRLIEHHILALRKAGITQIIINTGWLATRLHTELGNGARYGVNIQYSDEGYPALETAGGIVKALPLLGPKPFIVVNGDVYTDFDFSLLALSARDLGQLVLIPNPEHNPSGDFSLENSRVVSPAAKSLTFSGIALYDPKLFDGLKAERLRLKPVLDQAIARKRLGGITHEGQWQDIGTPERLNTLNRTLSG